MATYRFNNGVKTDNLYSIGATLTANNDISVTGTNNLTVVGGNVSLTGATGVLSVDNTTASTGVGTGAVQISGGVYVAAASVIDNTLDLGNNLAFTSGTDAQRQITNGPSTSSVTFVDTDYVTKWYVDSVATGVNPIGGSRVATTVAIGPSSTPETDTFTGTGVLPAIDGVTLSVGDFLLVKNEALPRENGIYIVTDDGATPGPNFILDRVDGVNNFPNPALNNGVSAQGAITFIEEGATQAGNQYICTATAPIDVVNTNDLPWTLFSSAITPSLNQVLGAGNTTGGNNINITSGDSIIGTGDIPITPAVLSNLVLNGGSGTGGTGGIVDINGGNGTSGTDGGAVTINAGTGDGAGAGADVSITAGSSTTGTAGNVVLNAPAPVGGTAGDISFTARGTTLTFNDATNDTLNAPPYTGITSIVGALNLIGSGGVAESLEDTLAIGDFTGANNIVVTTGQKVSGAAELTLDSTAGALTATANSGNLVLESVGAAVNITSTTSTSITAGGTITSTSGSNSNNEIKTQDSSAVNAGNVVLMPGDGTGATDNGGTVDIDAGNATGSNGDGGAVDIKAGDANSGDGGDILLTAGTSASGTSGGITLVVPNSGTLSDITLTSRGSSLTFNQSGDTALVGFDVSTTSIVAALNELASGSNAGANPLAYHLISTDVETLGTSATTIVNFGWDNSLYTTIFDTNKTSRCVLYGTAGDIENCIVRVFAGATEIGTGTLTGGSGAQILEFTIDLSLISAADQLITVQTTQANAGGTTTAVINSLALEFNLP